MKKLILLFLTAMITSSADAQGVNERAIEMFNNSNEIIKHEEHLSSENYTSTTQVIELTKHRLDLESKFSLNNLHSPDVILKAFLLLIIDNKINNEFAVFG